MDYTLATTEQLIAIIDRGLYTAGAVAIGAAAQADQDAYHEAVAELHRRMDGEA